MVGDIGGGSLYLVIGILSGLIKAQKTGEGTVVDAAIVDGSAHMLNLLMSMQETSSIQMKRGLSLLDGSHLSRCYKCSDEKYISVQCLEPKFYNQFLEVLSVDKNPLMQTQYDSSQWNAQTEFLSNIFLEKAQAYWTDLFSDLDACVAPILNPEEAEFEPHIKSREIWVRENGYLMGSAAPRFDDKMPKKLQSEITIDKKDIISSWT